MSFKRVFCVPKIVPSVRRTQSIAKSQSGAQNPRWSPQNRPCVDVSKPAMESGLRQVLFYPAEVSLARQDSISVTC